MVYFISFSHKFPKFRRHPLQGLWQNVVIPFYIPQTSCQHSTLALEAKAEDSSRTLDTHTDIKYSAPERLCFLPDADTELCVFEANNTLKPLTPKSIETKSTAQCSSSDTEGSDSADSDDTLNDFQSYACFENDDISLCSDRTPKKLMVRRRLPSVKKQKYDYVQSKVKQYVKSKANHHKT
ncbi:uncharacterized protein LOC128302618 [Anopheles moucheti]|uniref:uncharacterized protein LOC128302618 n=1 Tax=Anopheles moucheti TaxID=186751 RepID=UPI0022F0FC55|nr:uncharacterized protein LOC128302618 [Anopheles moucheti]